MRCVYVNTSSALHLKLFNNRYLNVPLLVECLSRGAVHFNYPLRGRDHQIIVQGGTSMICPYAARIIGGGLSVISVPGIKILRVTGREKVKDASNVLRPYYNLSPRKEIMYRTQFTRINDYIENVLIDTI